MYEKKPWLKYYGDVPHEIKIPELSMYECVALAVADFYDEIAYDFMGSKVTYIEFKKQIDECAEALAALGLKKGDRVTISRPTSPPMSTPSRSSQKASLSWSPAKRPERPSLQRFRTPSRPCLSLSKKDTFTLPFPDYSA